ncbi:MAG: malto-oligosyltrehalose trehalohydrolase, partial [Candidatus Hydrogenedentales bacterium]
MEPQRYMTVPQIGARMQSDSRCFFRVWAPHHKEVAVRLLAPHNREIPLVTEGRGYFRASVTDVQPGARYKLRIAGQDLPDPASQFQPDGVHGPSEVVAHDFGWTDHTWNNLPLGRYVIYELHTGTFTPDGTLDAIIPHLDELRGLGITAIEVMPVNQFPGARNWGYDGVGLFAVQNSYGGPMAFKRLVNACHERGLAVILDVVYNHIGPEGNYFSLFGPYFTDHYKTPWGDALNFDGGGSDGVRAFFLANIRQWFEEFHVDALRLDAVHAIYDGSARPVLAEFAQFTRQLEQRLGRRLYLMPETDLNDPRIVRAPELGGFGHDAQWNDDFHHAVHTLLTGERQGYYADFGRVSDLAAAYERGYVYEGQYSEYRDRRHGALTTGLTAQRFVVCSQNHDQIGNRAQ